MTNQPRTAKIRTWSIRIFSLIILALLLLARIGYGQNQLIDSKHSILQGSLEIQPVKLLSSEQKGKIQPGTPVKLVVTVENRGLKSSPPGKLYVRYAFPHPLDTQPMSILFETEKRDFPAIQPGKKMDIVFDAQHQIPSILDFVRDDWSMREYQVLVDVNQNEKLIGTLALTYSAYYYPGVKKEFPMNVSF